MKKWLNKRLITGLTCAAVVLAMAGNSFWLASAEDTRDKAAVSELSEKEKEQQKKAKLEQEKKEKAAQAEADKKAKEAKAASESESKSGTASDKEQADSSKQEEPKKEEPKKEEPKQEESKEENSEQKDTKNEDTKGDSDKNAQKNEAGKEESKETKPEDQTQKDQDQKNTDQKNADKSDETDKDIANQKGEKKEAAKDSKKTEAADKDAEVEAKYPAKESDAAWTYDYPPSWAGSGKQYLKGNLAVAEQVRVLEDALHSRVSKAKKTLGLSSDAKVSYGNNTYLDAIAVYAVRHDMTGNYPYGVKFANQSARKELNSIFNEVIQVQLSADGKSVDVAAISGDEMTAKYGFNKDQQKKLTKLLTDDTRSKVKGEYDHSILSILSDSEFDKIEEMIPDGISGERRAVLLAGLSLEGKVSYFWGAKSYNVGWDGRWGNMYTVSAPGTAQSGTVRRFGLDCSGFVSWAFINAGGNQNVLGYIGNGTANQWANSKSVSWADAKPGDLVFYKTPNSAGINHIGIIVSTSGGLKIVHCAGSQNGVVVTGKQGFQFVRRPYIYTE